MPYGMPPPPPGLWYIMPAGGAGMAGMAGRQAGRQADAMWAGEGGAARRQEGSLAETGAAMHCDGLV